MKKKILSFTLFFFLVPSLVLAQVPIRNDGAFNGVGSVIGSGNLNPSAIAVDSNGRIGSIIISPGGSEESVFPISNATNLNGTGVIPVPVSRALTSTVTTGSTTTVIQITGILAAGARPGDYFEAITGTAANIGVWVPIFAVGTNSITLSNQLPAAPVSTDTGYILRPEPLFAPSQGTNAASADNGIPLTFAVNNGFSARGANGQYVLGNADVYGSAIVDLDPRANTSNVSPVKREDVAFSASDGVLVAGMEVQSALSNDTTANSVGPIKGDQLGRLITTLAPAGETWQSCGQAIGTTSVVAIKAAVASNRIYVTSVNCSNSSATTATPIIFRDGPSTDIATGGIGSITATSPGSFATTFPVPLRGSVNVAFNFLTSISTTSVYCCAQGYTSVN